MQSLLFNIIDNPILLRELRRRMRGRALIYSIITYIILMTISTVFVLLVTSPSPFAKASIQMLQQMQLTGERIYYWITGIQVMLVLIVAPTITAGMTTGEKERKTFDFIRVTTITRWMYVMGCFLSTAFYVGLALICSLPLISLTFLYGGVTIQDVATTFVYLLGMSCILSSFGLYVSSVCERTRTAQGIIVFLIFALLFGGFIVYQQIQMVFAGALGQTGAATNQVVYIFNVGVARWVLAAGGMALLTMIFLLLSARKLFEPEEVRAFAHWQFALLFGGYLAGYLGLLGATPFASEIPEIGFFVAGYAMLLIGVQTFAIGRMEMGDEIWHLKRLLPFLRPFDQTVPYLVGLGALWYLAVSSFDRVVFTLNMSTGGVDSLQLVTLSSFAFFCVIARAGTALARSKQIAGRYSLIIMTAILVVLPMIGLTMGAISSELGFLAREIAAFSPLAILIDQFNNPSAYNTGSTIGYPATVVYIILSVFLGLYGEVKRYFRWKGYNYHYDMPAG